MPSNSGEAVLALWEALRICVEAANVVLGN